ncbi:MAG: acyl-CoA reductase [Oscillospiraceae bacterium]|nr:acyl-CoA reductase [Oscillospiraceae bacterium]
MNLVDGRFLTADECEAVLDDLENRILATLGNGRLAPETVIAACDRLAGKLDEERYIARMDALGIPEALGRRYVAEAREIFKAEALRERLRAELGEDLQNAEPLGTLLHVAAGNADGLPAFSVLEGLLTGNINILKLPSEEGGASAELLRELILEEPGLAEYVYVFDYSSRDLVHISKLLAAADAVVVWGGDEAVRTLRSLVSPNTKLIEWGHKVSFGYVTRGGLTDDGLRGFARNIAETGGLLCSSCQGVYLDTEEISEVYALAERLLKLLERETAAYPPPTGISAMTTLELYTSELEAPFSGGRVFRGNGCGVTARGDRRLESAPAPRVPWVKALPRGELIWTLRPHKNHLQTVGLLCADDERGELTRALFRAGAVRVTSGERMSRAEPSAPHDGEWPLRRYVKLVRSGE